MAGEIVDFAFPLRLDSYGSVVERRGNSALSDIAEQILLTSIGERVYQPLFGSDLIRLIFRANNRSDSFWHDMLTSSIDDALSRSQMLDGEIRVRASSFDISTDGSSKIVFLELEDTRGERSTVSMEVGG